MKILILKSVHFLKLIGSLTVSIPFLTLSVVGNFIVISFAAVVYFIEKDVNPQMAEFVDAVWWSFATTTTIGYGDVVPVTILGKVFGIILMLVGVGIFGIYTAIIARAVLDDDVYME